MPQAGAYEVFVRYPQVSGAATDAKYTVNHSGGSVVKTVNQTANTGTWVSLGSYSFAEGNSHRVSLSDQAGGTVVADAVKLVRDNSGVVDDEKHDYAYKYDPNGNLTTITDASRDARVDTYAVQYTGLNQVEKVTESKDGAVKNTTSFTYNENSSPLTMKHDEQYSSYEYDVRDLVSKVTNGKSATDSSPKVTTYTYTDRGQKLREVKGNGNAVDYTYFLDGRLKVQTEKKPNGTLVSENTLEYDLNGNRSHDVTKKMNADNHGAYLTTTSDFTYDPRDRLASLTKTGDGAGTETYVHDANNNVIEQSIAGVQTKFNYDRNRLLTATGTSTASYNYDPFGRLDTVRADGKMIERNVYDGFDHIIENRKNDGTSTSTTRYTFDPLDRTTTKTTDAGGAKEKTTTFGYLGLSSEMLNEEVAGKLTKSYQYSPWGQRLSQVTHKDDGTEEDAYYGYNPHTDVQTLTDQSGDTKATYGYTAYGKNDEAQFTGIDKPDTADPTKEPYNAYRFNAKRWDQNSQSYDMGFRDYSPGLNRFLSRDSYNGALADMHLGLNPFTGNRYAFGGGNPISSVELDGHRLCEDECSGGGYGPDNQCASCYFGQYNSAHDTAIEMVAGWLTASQPAGGGYVTMDLSASGGIKDPRNRIAGGSSKNPGKNAGYADPLYWTDDAVYVWDAKVAGGPAERAGKKEVENKVRNLQAQLKAAGDTRTVKVGFAFPPMAAPNKMKATEWVTASPSLVSGSGVIAYRTWENKQPQPLPQPRTVPQEQPEETPWWETAKKWAAPVGLAVGATALVVGTVAEDVGTGGIGIADDPAVLRRSGCDVPFGICPRGLVDRRPRASLVGRAGAHPVGSRHGHFAADAADSGKGPGPGTVLP